MVKSGEYGELRVKNRNIQMQKYSNRVGWVLNLTMVKNGVYTTYTSFVVGAGLFSLIILSIDYYGKEAA